MALSSVEKKAIQGALGTTGTTVRDLLNSLSSATVGSLADSSGTDIKCDAYMTFTLGGITYYLPLYNSTA